MPTNLPIRLNRSDLRIGVQSARRWVTGSDPEYCFVFGCPRSGTTALTRLVQSDERIVLGMERYRLLLRTHEKRGTLHKFGPEMFKPRRFLSYHKGDTTVGPDDKQHARSWVTARERFERPGLRYVGDKLPQDSRIAHGLADNFPRAKFIFIYRDLARVASSYVVRARKAEDRWPSDATADVAAGHWEEAFASAESLLDRLGPSGVHVVCYEQLFSGDQAAFRAMFGFLGLEPSPAACAMFERLTLGWEERLTRPTALEDDELELLQKRADSDVRRRFDDYAAQSIELGEAALTAAGSGRRRLR
jgi:hypothetical protein